MLMLNKAKFPKVEMFDRLDDEDKLNCLMAIVGISLNNFNWKEAIRTRITLGCDQGHLRMFRNNGGVDLLRNKAFTLNAINNEIDRLKGKK